jgi:hypothetical protein
MRAFFCLFRRKKAGAIIGIKSILPYYCLYLGDKVGSGYAKGQCGISVN